MIDGLLKAAGMGVVVIATFTAYLLAAAWLAKRLGHDPSNPTVALTIFGVPCLILALLYN